MDYIKQDLKSTINVKQIVTIHYFELTKSANYPIDIHDFWEIHYVDKGTAICYEGGTRYVLEQGDILFNKPNTQHRLQANGEIAPNVCVISFVCHSRAMHAFENKKLHLTSEQTKILRKFFNEANVTFEISHTTPDLKELRKKSSAPLGSLQMLKIHLEEFFLLLLRDLNSKKAMLQPFLVVEEYSDPLVNDMIRYMQLHVDKKLTIADLCAAFHYSKSFLCNRFYSVTGRTINCFFNKMKINAAKRMIRSKDDTFKQLSQIADALNFSSPAYFSSIFKKMTGMTPCEYAASVRHYTIDKK